MKAQGQYTPQLTPLRFSVPHAAAIAFLVTLSSAIRRTPRASPLLLPICLAIANARLRARVAAPANDIARSPSTVALRDVM